MDHGCRRWVFRRAGAAAGTLIRRCAPPSPARGRRRKTSVTRNVTQGLRADIIAVGGTFSSAAAFSRHITRSKAHHLPSLERHLFQSTSSGFSRAPHLLRSASSGFSRALHLLQSASSGFSRAPHLLRGTSSGLSKAPHLLRSTSSGFSRAPHLLRSTSSASAERILRFSKAPTPHSPKHLDRRCEPLLSIDGDTRIGGRPKRRVIRPECLAGS
ncbi:hypothetical protein GGR60_003814 [Xanthomonas arboricola]|nr:hypothetical protein [Xanthomonas euroxanthea]